MVRRRLRTPSLGTVAAALAAGAALLILLLPGPASSAGGAASAPAASSARTASSAPTAASARGVQVSVHFLRGERLVPVRRTVVFPGLIRGAVLQLLAGPTATERRAGLSSTVPAGTRLNGVSLHGGVATVDLSQRFESGGGSLSMRARLAQLTSTVTQFPTVHAVRLRLDGKPVRVFGGEGLILDHPLTRADFRDFR